MKRYRSALMAGLLVLRVLGVAVCDDGDGTVTQPPIVNVAPPNVDVTVAPDPPTPPPPLTATISPASVDLPIGGMLDFAVGISGGTGDASWTCSSSDEAVATVTKTDTGCQAVAVAGGVASIIAAVTKGADTYPASALITVGTTADAFIILNDIVGAYDTDDSGLKGRVEVTVGVERGNNTFERLSLHVDGIEVDARAFGVAAAAETAEQSVYNFKLSFESNKYDPVTGAVDYMNGEHMIQAQLKVTGSDALTVSELQPVEFANDDGYVLTADLGANGMSSGGQMWYGGPSNGMVSISAVPVRYSGEAIMSLDMAFCGEDDSVDGAPYEFSLGCAGKDDEPYQSNMDADEGMVGDTPILSEDGKILNLADLPFPAFFDFVGPVGSPIIIANRGGRENGWINMYVGLTGEFDAMDAKNNWLVEGEEGEGGVGGYNMMVRLGKHGDADDREALLASAASAMPMMPAESSDGDSYCAIATATDDLGNESPLPDLNSDDDYTCRAPPAGADALVNHDVSSGPDADGMTTANVWGHDTTPDNDADDVTDLSGQTLAFGVDVTAPTVVFGDDYDDDNRHADVPGAFVFEAEDDENDVGNSNLDDDAGLMVGLMSRTASDTECVTIAGNGDVAADAEEDEDCKGTPITDEDVTLQAGVAGAFYTLSGMAQDQAGNRSAAISHTFVYDADIATATAPAVPGVIEAGKPFDGASYLNDNLSIRDYYGSADFGDVLNLGIGAPVAVDEFNASMLRNRNHPVSATVNTYAALQSQVGGNLTTLSGVTVAVRDQTGAYADESTTFTVTDAPEADDASATGDFTTDWAGRDDNDVYAFCGIAECDDEDAETSVKIEVMAIAPESGTFSNPLERVGFWMTDVAGVSWMIGSDTSGSSGRVGGDGENARWQTWSYSVTLPGTMLNMATRPGLGTETAMIRAIAVNDNNVGLVVSTGVAIDTTAP